MCCVRRSMRRKTADSTSSPSRIIICCGRTTSSPFSRQQSLLIDRGKFLSNMCLLMAQNVKKRTETMKTSSHFLARPPMISALGLLCAAQFVLQLDFSIVNVALPTIQRDLGFVPADLQWVVTGYALTFGSLLILGGRAGDLLGRRRLLLLSLLLFGLASLACGLAISPLMQILARLVQGGAAAFVSPSALS